MERKPISQPPAHEVYARLAEEGWLELTVVPTQPTRKLSEPGVDIYRQVRSPFELMRSVYDPKDAYPELQPSPYAPKPFQPRQ